MIGMKKSQREGEAGFLSLRLKDNMEKRGGVFVILVNWNQKTDIQECLESLQRTNYDNFRVMVIDNHSQDGSVELIRHRFPWVRMIENPTNLGFCAANNQGIKEGLRELADYFFVLNSDAIVGKETLKKLIVVMESDPRIGIAQPVFYYYNEPDKIWHSGGIIDLDHGYGPSADQISVLPDHLKSGFFETDFICGCGMLVRRNVFERVGLFDEDYFFSFEDIDLALRAKKNGFRLVTVSDAAVWHKLSGSAGGRPSGRHIYYSARNRLLFIRKNKTRPWYVYFPKEGKIYIRAFLGMIKRRNVKGLFFLVRAVWDFSLGVKGPGRPVC
jgi:GT2 family glycosyltransferase